MSAVTAVAYDDVGSFDVLENGLAELAAGGMVFHVNSKKRETNDNCIEDNNNQNCVTINNFCAADSACGEVDAPLG